MKILFFMPWVACGEPLDFGVLRLVPYERGVQPGVLNGVAQESLDAILGSYGDPDYYPSESTSKHVLDATLLVWPEDQEGGELEDDLVMRRWAQVQYVAFSALAQRQFCGHSGYCNSDGYQAIAQRFSAGAPGDTAVTRRRRDGHGLHHVGNASVPRFIRPEHVDEGLRLDIDPQLVIALLNVPSGEVKDRLDAAIDAFVKANTDSSAVLERAEMVLMRVAFETLLGSTHQTFDLRERFEHHFGSDLASPPKWQGGALTEKIWRTRWSKNVKRPLDAWVQDFCAGRNAVAHGPSGDQEPTVWPRHNHLLFASRLFPLMVKKVLAEHGLYQLSAEDLALRRGFEAYLAHDVLSRVDANMPELWWSRVERDLLWDIAWAGTFPASNENDSS